MHTSALVVLLQGKEAIWYAVDWNQMAKDNTVAFHTKKLKDLMRDESIKQSSSQHL